MSIEHFDTFERLQTIRQQLDELTRRFSTGEAFGGWIPSLDVLDEGSQYRIIMDIPGVKNQDLELLEEGSTITLAGVRYAPEANHIQQERPIGQFRRSIDLPLPIVAGSAQASLKSGVLEVVVKKARSKGQKGKK
ncbi:MAG: Hsp20/alpha crystallin family protein [Thermaceae bacterium]|nr:Hsp20/alpha crystallin family protein [Thermaceae bacterium]